MIAVRGLTLLVTALRCFAFLVHQKADKTVKPYEVYLLNESHRRKTLSREAR